MNTELVIEKLQSFAFFFRSGQPLEVTSALITLLSDILPGIMENRPDKLPCVQEILSDILRCQDNEDWLGLADYLEYELADVLKDF